MAQIVKQIKVDVGEENIFQSIIAKQFDIDSRFLTVQLTNEGTNISVNSTATVVINALREDNDSHAFAGTVNKDGTVTVPITSWMLELDGLVKCDISVYEGEQKLTSTTFTISVEAAAYDGNDITEDENYDILLTLIAECQEITTAEASRVTAENQRVSAENARVSAETGRDTAEGERESAESTRMANETTRKSNETSRKSNETSRNNAENARNTAETERVSAEKTRTSAETGRVNAENERVASETARSGAENHRVSAEQGRVTAEGERVTAEQGRVSAETERVNAENARNTAEQTRQTNTATAIGNANTAATNANNKADAANAAAQTADNASTEALAAAERANAAAQTIEDGLEASDISYDNSVSGLDSTNVKEALDEIVVKIGGVAKVESWEDVQKIVRLGLASKVFKIGEQLTCNKGSTQLIWDIIAFDHDIPVDNELNHSMTLQLHDVYSGNAVDEREAIIYAESEMVAGTYNFQIVTQPWYTADNGKTFQFTLTNPVPAGGQIVLDMTYNQTLDGKKVKTYESATSTIAIETATISEGNSGTALGKSDGTVANVNHIQRAIFGYNRWTHSAVRQWLNSDAAGDAWWQPQNIFDRPSMYRTTAGFLSDLDADFLAVIGEVTKRTAKNTVTDGGGYEDSVEKMFFISRSEIYGGNENGINEGDPYPYYSEYSDLTAPGTGTDSNRIKYRNGTAQYWWLRSCGAGSAHYVRRVYPSGVILIDVANSGTGVAPACNII